MKKKANLPNPEHLTRLLRDVLLVDLLEKVARTIVARCLVHLCL